MVQNSTTQFIATFCKEIKISDDDIGRKLIFWFGIYCQSRSIPCLLKSRFLALLGFNSSPPGKMADISQTISSKAFSWMKMVELKFKFHWNLFPGVQSSINQHWFDNGLVPNRRQTFTWTNDDPVHWRIYATLGGGGVNRHGNEYLYGNKPLPETILTVSRSRLTPMMACFLVIPNQYLTQFDSSPMWYVAFT